MVEHLSQERGKPIAKNFDFYRREIRRIRKEESKDAARMFDTLLVELSGKIDAAKDLGSVSVAADHLALMARIYALRGMLTRREASLSEAIALDGNCDMANLQMGDHYYDIGFRTKSEDDARANLTKAVRFFQRVYETAGTNGAVNQSAFKLAKCHELLGNNHRVMELKNFLLENVYDAGLLDEIRHLGSRP